MAHFARRVYILQSGCNEVLNEWHAFRKEKKNNGKIQGGTAPCILSLALRKEKLQSFIMD